MNVRPWNKFINAPGANPTQNRFQRGMSMPGSKLRSQFTDISEGFQTFMNDGLKTKYSKYLVPMGNPFYGGN